MTGVQLKLRGMRLAASKHKEELAYVRNLARYVARIKGIISIEDVRREAAIDSHKWELHNAAGAIFKGREWEFVGFMVAERPAAHARILRQWRLKQ